MFFTLVRRSKITVIISKNDIAISFFFFFTVDTCVMGLYCCFSVSPWLVVDEIKTFEITMFCHFENVNKLKREVSEYLQIY